MDKLSQKAKQGIIWLSVSRVVAKLISLSATILIARLLSPDDFGVVTLAMTIWSFANIVAQMGISSALIYQQKDLPEYTNAAFWFNLTIAVFLTILLLLIQPLLSAFFQNEMLSPILIALSFGFVINSLGTIHSALLTKELEFKKITQIEISVLMLEKASCIGLVLLGFGVWSLVLPNLFFSLPKTLAYWKMSKWQPQLKLDFYYWKGLFRYGKTVFGTDLIRYINFNSDYLLIGKLLGTSALGFYTLAYNLAEWPIHNFIFAVNRVSFPLFAKYQNDLPRLRQLYLKMINKISLIAFPLFTGFFICADLIVPYIYGTKWLPSVLPYKIILGFMLIRSIASLGGRVILAVGRPDIEFKFNLIQMPLLLLGILIGANWGGIVGVAISISVVLSLMSVFFIFLSNKLIHLQFSQLLRVIAPSQLAAFIMGSWLMMSRHYLIPSTLPVPLYLGFILIQGLVVYFMVIFLMFPKSFKLFKNRASRIMYPEHDSFYFTILRKWFQPGSSKSKTAYHR